MKFAHLADCHIGSWRDPALSNLSTKAFELAIDKIIDENVDFVLIAGDLFNTSLPSIDALKITTKKLKELKEKNIECYLIAGSHDFSPSGKTMLDVLENAGLCINVAKGEENNGKLQLKFTEDKTGAKITGLLGKTGGLEKNYYDALDRESLEQMAGYKIFLFHTLLTELKPKELEKVESSALSLLPKTFDYYAGGHPHFIYTKKHDNYGIISYPGPLFPNNFKEIEELHHGGFFIVEGDEVIRVPVKLYDVENIKIDADNKIPEEIESNLILKIENGDYENKIVTIRIEGVLRQGKPSDINFAHMFSRLREKNAFAILKNTAALSSKEFEDIKIEVKNTSELESNLIEESILDEDIENAKELTKKLLTVLDNPKQEGERVYDFEKRIIEEMDKLILKKNDILPK